MASRASMGLAIATVVLALCGVAVTTGVAAIDGDGAPPVRELSAGTDPLATDTDGDGLDDGEEADASTDPLRSDTDGDGLDDGVEAGGSSDPTARDTDGDGLDDGEEPKVGTDPTVSDTDGDGLDDGGEIDAGTDPLEEDSDGDGLFDSREIEGRSDPTVADTDGDELGDGTEVEAGTRAYDNDTDSDGLDDGRELELGTDPLEFDTDGDTLPDGWEVAEQSPKGTPLPGADPLAMDLYVEVNLAKGASGLDDYSPVVESFAEMPVENPDGSTGIRLHVTVDERLDERVRYDGSNYDDIGEKYLEPLTADRRTTYHSVLFVTSTTHESVGHGDAPGTDSVVVGDRTDRRMAGTMVHELLHNVVGEIEDDGHCPGDDEHYCEGGWLASSQSSDDRYLPVPIADQIERKGFAA